MISYNPLSGPNAAGGDMRTPEKAATQATASARRFSCSVWFCCLRFISFSCY